MSKDEKEICLYCKAWNPTYDVGENPRFWTGQCRMKSPEYIETPTIESGAAGWPKTKGHDWCLAFEPKDDAAHAPDAMRKANEILLGKSDV